MCSLASDSEGVGADVSGYGPRRVPAVRDPPERVASRSRPASQLAIGPLVASASSRKVRCARVTTGASRSRTLLRPSARPSRTPPLSFPPPSPHFSLPSLVIGATCVVAPTIGERPIANAGCATPLAKWWLYGIHTAAVSHTLCCTAWSLASFPPSIGVLWALGACQGFWKRLYASSCRILRCESLLFLYTGKIYRSITPWYLLKTWLLECSIRLGRSPQSPQKQRA